MIKLSEVLAVAIDSWLAIKPIRNLDLLSKMAEVSYALFMICGSTSYSAELPPVITCGPDMETLSPEEIQQNIAELDFYEAQSIKKQSGLSNLEWKKLNGEFSELELLAGSLDYDIPKTINMNEADNSFSLSFETNIPVPKTPIDQSFLEDFDFFMQGKIDIETLLDGRYCIFEVSESISCVSEGLFGSYDSLSALDEYNIRSGKENSFLSLTTISYEQLGLSSDDVFELEKAISTGMIASFVKERKCIVKQDAVYCQMSQGEMAHPSAERLKPNRDGWFKVPGTSGSDGNVSAGPKILSQSERSKLLIGGEELGERVKFRGEAPGRCYACHDPAKKLEAKREWTLGSSHRAGLEQAGESGAFFGILGGGFSILATGGNPAAAANMGQYFGYLGAVNGYVQGALESVIWQRGDEKNVILLPKDHPNVGDRGDGVDYENTDEADSQGEADSKNKEVENNGGNDKNSSMLDNKDNDFSEPNFEAEELCMDNAEHTGCSFDPTIDNTPKVEDVFCKPRTKPISNVETYDPIFSDLDESYTKELGSIRDLFDAIKNNPRLISNPNGLPLGGKAIGDNLNPDVVRHDPEVCRILGITCS